MNQYKFVLHKTNGRVWDWRFTCEPHLTMDYMDRAVREYRGADVTEQLHFSLYQRKPNSFASSLVERGTTEIYDEHGHNSFTSRRTA